MKLTKKDRKLLKQSIEHWKNDIKEPVVRLSSQLEGISKYPFLDGSDDCPLCEVYQYTTLFRCEKCPYLLFYGFSCDNLNGHWIKWLYNRSLKTCNDMIKSLEKILNESE